jgi:putative CocE/NonD family hydrolase
VTTTAQRPADSTVRTLVRRYGDRAVGRLLRLPPPTTGYTINRGVRVPMRDGVDLRADHYAPATNRPAGTLLMRGPYGRGFPLSVFFARLYAARGYHVVVQSVRGTFGSAGVFEPMLHEVADGADTAAWLRQQAWFTGRFATVGMSYLGFTQWALLQDSPPDMAAAVITVGPHDFSASSWGTGAFSLNDFLGWSDVVGHQEEGGRLRALIRSAGTRRRLARAVNALPLGAAGRRLLGTTAPWYESWLEHPDRDDPFWDPFRFGVALDRVEVPVLLITGWQDVFLEQTLEQYNRLSRRAAEVALTVGPWTHAQLMTKGAGPVARESLEWLGAHLAGVGEAPKRSRVDLQIRPR